MMYFDWFEYIWRENKEYLVFEERSITFFDIIESLEDWSLVGVTPHRNQQKYPEQKILICNISNYIWYVPFKEEWNIRTLITIIPSRKLTKKYL